MIYGLIFIFYKELSTLIYPIKVHKSSIIKIQKNNQYYIKKLSDLEILTYFNDKSKDESINIMETNILQNSIEIKMIGPFQNIMDILNEISNNFKIKQFEINKIDNKIDVSMKLDREMHTIMENNKLKKERIPNPFIREEVKNKYKASRIMLSAIVNLEILVNNTWYKTGDYIKEYLVLSIEKNKVIFLNTKINKKIVKRISDE